MNEFPPLGEPMIHPTAFVADTARVFGDVRIGAEASVWFGASIRAEVASVTIGVGTNVQDNAVLHTDDGYPITLGDSVTIGHNAIVHGAVVEDGALVGMGAICLNGALVEAGALLAAGAVVPPGGVVPAGMLAVGNPMRVLRPIRPEENAATDRGLRHYMYYSNVYKDLQGNGN